MYQFPRFIKENDIDTNNPNSSYIDMFVLVPTTTKKATHYVRSLWNKMEAAQASAQRTTYFKHKVGWWTLKILTHLFMFWIPRLTIEKAQNKVLETAKPEILFAVSWPTYSHDFKYQWQLPLNYMEHTKDIEINDHIFKINSDIEKHLANWYGDNWRIPIKSNKAIFYGYYECYKK